MIIALHIIIFLLGACLGSFCNVVIHRVPLGLSVVSPRSRCPECEKEIYWYENIPIFSFLFLKGKCSDCKTKISIRYPIIELISGIAALVFFNGRLSPMHLYFFIFNLSIFLIFLCMFLIDLEHKILPDSLNLYLGSILLAFGVWKLPWPHMLLGFLIGGGFPFLITWLFYKIRGQIGLGGGDIKLWAALGIFLGPVDIVHNIFMSCFVGAVVGVSLIALKKMSRENAIPFGPFIILVAAFQIFFPEYYAQLKSFIV